MIGYVTRAVSIRGVAHQIPRQTMDAQAVSSSGGRQMIKGPSGRIPGSVGGAKGEHLVFSVIDRDRA